MANTDKNIVITPNNGSSTADPKIVFSGADASNGAQNITLQVYPTNNGTVSFEGSAGQLFSITNNLSGTIFSVNDVSGIPSIEVLDTGLVKMAQYSGNVCIGYSSDQNYKFACNGVMYGTATSARYADLAENYVSDADYPAGTVLVFGGSAEVTITTTDHDTRVAGVVSTNPAYLMNADVIENTVPVALTGRVPCKVSGPVNKGDVLVTSNMAGVARAIDYARHKPGCVIGKALEAVAPDEVKTIEVVVGRF